MQTTFPKIAAVVLFICAVAFMGMSVAAYFGRPSAVSEMGSAEISDYNFQQLPGAEGGWSVKRSIGDNPAQKQAKTSFEAVAFAFDDKTKILTAETNAMNALTEKLRAQITQTRDEQAADIVGLDKRIATLTKYVDDADQALMTKSLELQKISVETADVRRETSKRREDVKRLQSELDELRTDRFRLEEILRVLTDRLVRLQLENQALELRLGQITSQSGQ